jgi:hypothetical protein
MRKFILLFLLINPVFISYSQELQKLIAKGDLAGIQKLEAKGVDIFDYVTVEYRYAGEEEMSTTEMYPMTYAAARNEVEIVKYYLTKKEEMVRVGSWDDVLGLSFVVSISTRNDELIELLYSHNPNLNVLCESCRGHNAVMVAAAYGMEKWYFKLKEKSLLIFTNEQGANILHIAVAGGSKAIVEDIIYSNFLDIDATDISGNTVLDYALLDSNTQLFSFLLEKHADLNKSHNLWYSITECGDTSIFNYMMVNLNPMWLVNYDENYEWPLHYAIGFDETYIALEMIRIMKLVVEAKGIVNFDQAPFDESEYHLLYWAISLNNKTTFEAVFDFAAFLNKAMDDPDYIAFPAYLEKSARKVFGKEFVTEMNEKYQVNWY